MDAHAIESEPDGHSEVQSLNTKSILDTGRMRSRVLSLRFQFSDLGPGFQVPLLPLNSKMYSANVVG